MTIVYLIRHSKTLKVNNNHNIDNLQIQNEKQSLSIEGEQIAKERLDNNEFSNIDVLYASNYVRVIQTAKYIANKNNLDINVATDLGERKFGISTWEELPDGFERKQFLDEEYKIGNGENQQEVRDRMHRIVMKIVNENKDKRIAIVSHGTATSYLLKKWCDIQVKDDKLRYSFNNNIIFDGYFNYCETFKLRFDDNNEVISIENIKFE